MTVINVVNKSTLVPTPDVPIMVRACAYQVWYEVAPLFGLVRIPVIWLPDEKYAQPGSWVIAILDDPTAADELGWHSENQGDIIYGRVFARPVLDNGGDILGKPLSVASVLSHEVVETVVDPRCNLWADNGQGLAVAYEAADPVENDSYPVSVKQPTGDPVTVTLSNFVTPAWFDPNAAPTDRFDRMSRLKAPFTMTQRGYMITMREGEVAQVYGEEYPAWRKSTKVDTSRTGRRTLRGET